MSPPTLIRTIPNIAIARNVCQMTDSTVSANREVAHVGPFMEAERHVMNLRNIASFVQREDPEFAEELVDAAAYIEGLNK